MFDSKLIDLKAKKLEEAAVQLKIELFGMDEIIDKIINSIRAWYTFPELIQRPVIVNLWGLTGVGKTQLVRRLAALLDMNNKFVEVQMDGVTSSVSNTETTIANVLAQSSIEEGTPGILLLDEFQRYRAVDQDGHDVKTERFQDVWMLLSDGKFSANASLFRDIEMMIANQSWSADMAQIEEPEKKRRTKKEEPIVKKRKYSTYPWEARNIKRQLKLVETIEEIMTWDANKLMDVLEDVQRNKAGLQLDFSKLLIIVSGNLDEVYQISQSVNDCDTDADIFHDITKKLSVTDIKNALRNRFKPEQISRLGNNHIIYPSLKRATYQQLIKHTCNKYVDGMRDITGINFTIDQSTYDEIYENAVYPAQGTRPVFSSVHKIFSDALVQISFWAIKNNITQIKLLIDSEKSVLRGVHTKKWTVDIPIDLDIRAKRNKATDDFKALVAVHEAGHALVYALLTKCAPAEVKINNASFTGGYMIPHSASSVQSKRQYLDRIAVCYAGVCAESVVFGPHARTGGCISDIATATSIASGYVRQLGMDGKASFVGSDEGDIVGAISRNTDVEPTNTEIESILVTQRDRATQLLTDNVGVLKKLVTRLISGEVLGPNEFKALLPELEFTDSLEEPFHQMWEQFSSKV